MIPYKDIGDNLTVNEFNGVISLLRDNINFEENLTINNSTVKGQYAEYVFDFQEATVLDNGILITNETLSNIGTVKLTKAVFPHSNYFLDLKVYSSTDVGISDMEHSDYIITEISIPLKHNTEVNIPFETLEMDNIISFDAKIRINHKDLIIRGTDRLSLSTIRNPLLNYVPSNLEAVYVDADGHPVADKQVNFYEGETLLGTDTTDETGKATLNAPFSSIGSHTVQATSESLFSNNSSVTVVDDGDFSFVISGNAFETYASNPFTFSENELQIEFGDNNGIAYTNGKITHNYSSSGNHTITILGEITKLNEDCFRNSTLSSITIPNTVTAIDSGCFSDCSELTSVTLPNTLTELNSALFAHCTSLNSINIPANVTSIGTSCFYHCTGLTTVTLPNNLISIGRDSFNYCTGLTTITLPDTLESIDNHGFAYCTGITSITLPDSLTNMGIECFSGCTGLTTINIPANVTSIGTNAFWDCTNLQEIALNWDTSSEIVSYISAWIRGCSSFTHFLIPQGTTSLYTAKGYPSNKLVENVSYTDIVGSTNKPILSYADGDKATLYAQLVDGQGQSVAISNVEITFKVGSTILGSAYTDSNGKATLTDGYTSVGAGDVQITVTDGISVTETYEVQDCRKYIPTSSTASSSSSKLNNVADFGVLDTDGLYYSAILSFNTLVNVVGGLCVVNNVQTSPVSPYPSGYIDYRLFSDRSNKGLGGGQASGGDYGMYTTSGALSTNTDYLFEMEFKNSQLTGRITQISNSTVVYEQTITPPKDYSNYHFALFLFSGITVTYSNVKVKPL